MPDCDVLIIGGGPAGLRAAELTSGAGLRTVVADRMPSVGRKFLVAGHGGLNLTHSEPIELFLSRYADASRWQSLLSDFSPTDLRAWAESLDVKTFVGTSGRVFPLSKQAAPLLRRWIARLKERDVEFRLRHDWRGLEVLAAHRVMFETTAGPDILIARTVILALGGGSWPQTGSTGSWVSILQAAGVEIAPLTPANCGYEVDWPVEFLEAAEGRPLKNIAVCAHSEWVQGELLVTRYGLEGGALYQLGQALRERAGESLVITIDLKPTFTANQLAAKISSRSADLLHAASVAWKLGTVAAALLRLRAQDQITSDQLAAMAKAYPVVLRGPRPIAEAISSAGGVAWSELDGNLMLKRLPGVFCAGEMINWEAPTGGYLLQGCLATGTRAARGAQQFLQASRSKE